MSSISPPQLHRDFDPKVQPVVPVVALPPVPPGVLTLEGLREAFREPVPWQVEPLFIESFSAERVASSSARHAAVLMPFVQRAGGVSMLFTRRSEQLHHHAGQVSFPGGCIEPDDTGVVAAALRETREEIGVERRFVHVLGTQPTLLTTTGFLMTPVVAELLPGFQVEPEGDEVAEVFEVPLSVLMDPGRYELRQLRTQWGHGRYFFAIPWDSHFIWGATAVLLRNLYHFLAASFSARMR
ncbi:MAG TPA: CoA pyrophosphatase [Castellaniella sp.]|uniref:CoA pyrophosphatase n=1 Tax=Castellaniella sp. TaxID=1955812 RepID=UPI002F1CB9B2